MGHGRSYLIIVIISISIIIIVAMNSFKYSRTLRVLPVVQRHFSDVVQDMSLHRQVGVGGCGCRPAAVAVG